MIIVFADDHTVDVLPDIEAVRKECEAVDVEEGLYTFFDELGRRLVPKLLEPVPRGSSFFGALKWVGSARFELELDSQDDETLFENEIANVAAINPNPWFESVADLARHVADNRKQE